MEASTLTELTANISNMELINLGSLMYFMQTFFYLNNIFNPSIFNKCIMRVIYGF